MKISFVDDEPEVFPIQYGGKARTIMNLAKGFAKNDYVEEVAILSRTINDRRKEFYWEGIKFKKLEGYNILSQIVKEANSADILNIHTCSFTPPRLENCKAALVYHLHDVMFTTADKGSSLDKAISGSWDTVVSPSIFASNTYSNFALPNVTSSKIFTIPRAIDKEMFYPVNSKDAFSNLIRFGLLFNSKIRSYPIILFPSRIDARKGEQYLEQIHCKLSDQHPNLLILTTLDPNKVLDHPSVINLGWLPADKMKYLYAIADLTIALSKMPESFSQICIESIACGTPVLSFKFGNLSDFSRKLPAIKICKPAINEIILKISDILQHPANIAKDIIKSQKIIDKEYDSDKVIKTYMALYRDLVSNKLRQDVVVLNKKEKRVFVSPLLAIYDNEAYLSDEQKIKRIVLNADERKVLGRCSTITTRNNLYLTTKIEKVKLDSILKRFITQGLLIEG